MCVFHNLAYISGAIFVGIPDKTCVFYCGCELDLSKFNCFEFVGETKWIIYQVDSRIHSRRIILNWVFSFLSVILQSELKVTTCVLPAAALRCGRRHWARGSWPYPAPAARWAQSCKAGRPIWTWGRWAGASGQTHAGRCNVGRSSSGRRGHNRAQPTKTEDKIVSVFKLHQDT